MLTCMHVFGDDPFAIRSLIGVPFLAQYIDGGKALKIVKGSKAIPGPSDAVPHCPTLTKVYAICCSLGYKPAFVA